MAIYTGKCDFLALQKESTYAGTPTGTKFFIPVDAPVRPKAEQNTKMIDPVICRVEEGTDSVATSQKGSFDAEGMVRPRTFGILLKSIFGTVSTTGAGPYTHAFSVLNSNDPNGNSLRGEFGKGANEMLNYAMMKGILVDSLSINIVSEDTVNWKASFLGQYPESNTNSNLSLVDEAVMKSILAKITIPEISANPLDLTSFDLEIQSGVEQYYTLGKLQPEGYQSKRAVSGSFSFIAENADAVAKVNDHSKLTMRVVIEDTAVDLGGGVHPKLTINLAQVRVNEPDISGGKSEKVEVTLAFVGEYSLSAGKMIDAELINDEASY